MDYTSHKGRVGRRFVLTDKKNHPNSADYIVQLLINNAITHVFLLPGLTITPIMQSLSEAAKIEVIIPTSEAGAAFMADAYARVTGHFGVCIVIANPGTMNLVPSISAAFQDKVPVLVIAGSTLSSLEGRGAFQDTSEAGSNDVTIMSHITGYAAVANHNISLNKQFERGLSCLLGCPKLPVYIQVPIDIQLKPAPEAKPLSVDYVRNIDFNALNTINKQYFSQISKIIILVGKGMNREPNGEKLVAFAEYFKIPVATTLCAKGVMPEDHPLSLGVFGFGGNRRANLAILSHENKLLITLCVDFTQRNTLCWTSQLQTTCKIIQIDSDDKHLGKNYPVSIGFKSCATTLLSYLMSDKSTCKNTLAQGTSERMDWIKKIQEIPMHYDVDAVRSSQCPIHPARVIHELRQVMPKDTIIIVDSGAHRIFAAHYWQAYKPQQYLTTVNNATMGWAIAAGIGAKIAKPDSPCVVITGDGCMLMHGNEIQTASRYGIAVILVVVNNQAHSQNTFYRKLPDHNWSQYAEAFGLYSFTVLKPENLSSVFQQAFLLNKPCLIEVKCSANITPPNYDYVREEEAHYKLEEVMV